MYDEKNRIGVIFLDFDGVINNWISQDEVDELNVKILKDIIDASGAKVIAITSNKYPFQLKKEKSMLKTRFGRDLLQLKRLEVSVDGVTPLVNCNRALEIIEYLNANKNETSEDRIRRINEYYNSRGNANDEKCH